MAIQIILTMDNGSVKRNIRESRKNSHLSQQEMADRLGMSRNAYRDIEQGRTKLINGNLEQIAQITGTSAEKLILGFSRNTQETAAQVDVIRTLENRISDLEEKLRLKEETIDILKRNNDTLRSIVDRIG